MKIFGLTITKESSPVVTEATRSRDAGEMQASDHPSNSTGTRSYFEALDDDGSRGALPAGVTSLTSVIRSMQRKQIGGVSRWLYDNHPLVGYAVDLLKLYSTPIAPQAMTGDFKTDNQFEEYFANWSQRAEFTGRFTFNEMLELLSIAMNTDGDLGILATSENGFVQMQMIDSSLIASENENLIEVGGKETIPAYQDGVKVDSKGRVQGYSLAQADARKFKLYPSSSMFLGFEADRHTRYRGFSPLRRGANDMRDGNEIKKFLKLGVKYDSAILAVLQNELGEEDEDDWGNDAANQPYIDASAHEKKVGLKDLLGGQIPILPEGTELKQLNTNRPEKNVIQFVQLLAGHMVMGLGLPSAFFLDERLTGPNTRAVNGKAQRRFEQHQQTIARFVQWAWVRVIGDAIARGELPAVNNWYRCNFQFPQKITIDAGRESAQEREDVGKALMTRREHFGNRGRDWMRETDQYFKEVDYIAMKSNEIATKYGIDANTIFTSLITPTSAGSTSNDDEKDNKKKKKDDDDE